MVNESKSYSPEERYKLIGKLIEEVKLRRKFPEKKYHRRSIIENMWFCVKRLCGNTMKAKKWIMQKKELLVRLICYNLNRLVKLQRV